MLPGAGDSPGASTCNLVNAPALTERAELVLPVIPACVVSDAVKVGLRAVFNVTPKVWLPASNPALLGKFALLSLDVIAMTSLVLIRFQLASTAFTVTEK